MNITVQLARIADADGCQPGHAQYLKKSDMSAIAKNILDEHENLIHAAGDLQEVCKTAKAALNTCIRFLLETGPQPEPVPMARATTQIDKALAKADGKPWPKSRSKVQE